jgi:hypothetical protein
MTKTELKKNLKYGSAALIGAVIILGGAYYLHTATTAGSQQPGFSVRTYNLVVQNRHLIEGDTVLTAKKGDTVSITITADESDELHLHGYDLSTEFEAGAPATITFVANKTGRFPMEMEGSKTELGEVQVQP